MFDPGAMGTLVLGLDRQRRERELGAMESPSRPVPAPGRRSGLSIALAIARVLRFTADRLDPNPKSAAVSAAR